VTIDTISAVITDFMNPTSTQPIVDITASILGKYNDVLGTTMFAV
jgi:hypothetical protein